MSNHKQSAAEKKINIFKSHAARLKCACSKLLDEKITHAHVRSLNYYVCHVLRRKHIHFLVTCKKKLVLV